MKIHDVKKPESLSPLKLSVSETPHLTIEPNMTCNIWCQCCYKLDRVHVKTLEEVKGEIDLSIKKRNLQAITLLGGEPTLHPDIIEIISYIKSKKLICQILTNGVAFLNDEQDLLLDAVIQAGIDKILLHIDSGQDHIHKDIEKTRRALFTKLEKKKISFSLSVTIYNKDRCMIPRLIREYSKYRFFDGILCVLAREPLPPRYQNTTLLDEYRNISHELKIEPAMYVPSNMDDADVCWLFYFFFTDCITGETFDISPAVNRQLRKWYRLAKGCHLFVISINPSSFRIVLFLILLMETLNHPQRLGVSLRFLITSLKRNSIRFLYIVIQKPPEEDKEKGEIRLCYHCPDATIRNGLLTPVCLADQINPLKNSSGKADIREDWYQTVYEHLGEI